MMAYYVVTKELKLQFGHFLSPINHASMLPHEKSKAYWRTFLITHAHIKMMMVSYKKAMAPHSCDHLSCTDGAKGSFGRQHMQELDLISKFSQYTIKLCEQGREVQS